MPSALRIDRAVSTVFSPPRSDRRPPTTNQFPRRGKHVVEHRLRQTPGERILLARMIAAEQRPTAGQFDARSMCEFRQPPFMPSASPRKIDHGPPCNLPQRHDGPRPHRVERCVEPLATRRDLLWQRFVVRRSAVADRGDSTIDEFQSIVRRSCRRLIGEAGPMERPIQPLAATVAGKHPACSIRTMRRWGKADDQQSCRRIAEIRHGPAPILPIGKACSLRHRHVLAMRNQPRASLARDNAAIEIVERIGGNLATRHGGCASEHDAAATSRQPAARRSPAGSIAG